MPELQFLEHLPVAAYSCDHLGRLNFFNEHVAELLGKRPIIGKGLWSGSCKLKQANGKLLAGNEYPLAKAIKENKFPERQEIIIERPDGSRKNVLSYPKLLQNEQGNVLGGYNLLIDITTCQNSGIDSNKVKLDDKFPFNLNQKLVINKQSFQKNEERYYKMIEEVQDYVILLLDVDGTILNWNRGAEKIKGYKEEEIIGKNFRIFYLDEDREKMLPEKLIKIATNEGKAMQEGWRKRKDGTKFWGFIVITALHDNKNNIIGFSKVTRDLSERKANEDQLKLYARNIEIKNKQLEEYAYVASHDLQEPLRKIQIFIELLEKNIDNKENAKRHLAKITSSAKRMSILIKDVLKYSQLSQQDELLTEIDLNAVLENVKEDHDLLIEEKKAQISIGQLPKINGISIQMHQLFSNLIGNALKFTKLDPRVEISCEKISGGLVPSLEQIKSYSTYYKIDVKDNGPGFDAIYQEHVFKLFKRLDENQKGTGIGLAICRKIVENHKGVISVSSEKSKGTVFSIYLPA